MNDRAALVDAIIAAIPEGWTAFQNVRMVFADWLEEHGLDRRDALLEPTATAPRLSLPHVESLWRRTSRNIIARALLDCDVVMPMATVAQKRKFINERYPFGERRMVPYKAWLLECRIALDGYKPRGEKSRRRMHELAKRGELF